MSAIIEEFSGESDRAVAIVGAAWIEEALSDAIAARLKPHAEASKRLFGNAGGALATFSAKIDLARLLDVISDAIRSDLHAIREVRNEFAHHVAHKVEHTRLTFAAQHIRDRCLALRCVAHEKHTDAREAFSRACASLNADLELVKFMSQPIADNGRVIAPFEGHNGATIMY